MRLSWLLLALFVTPIWTLSNAQDTADRPAVSSAEEGGGLSLVGSVFVTGATVIATCGEAGQPPNRTCQALVMGLYNGFIHGASYGGFVTCVPENIGSDQMVALFVAYARIEASAEWDHAGNTMAELIQELGWGGYEGEACLEEAYLAATDDASGPPDTTDAGAGDQLMQSMAGADPIDGQQVFGMCSACHAAQDGARNLIGPHLWEIVERPIGAIEGFRYSDAMNELGDSEENWSLALLDAYLQSPRAAVPGTSMMFRGVADATDRINLLAYLASLTAD